MELASFYDIEPIRWISFLVDVFSLRVGFEERIEIDISNEVIVPLFAQTQRLKVLNVLLQLLLLVNLKDVVELLPTQDPEGTVLVRGWIKNLRRST